MPKKRSGHTALTITVPDSLLELLKEAAHGSKFRRLTPWVVSVLARKVGAEFEPVKPGPQPDKEKNQE